jgi:hypothetical protein
LNHFTGNLLCSDSVREGAENGAVDPEHGTSIGKFTFTHKGSSIIVRGISFMFNHHTCIKDCIGVYITKCLNIPSPLQVKNKPCDGDSEHVFILVSLSSTVATSEYCVSIGAYYLMQ